MPRAPHVDHPSGSPPLPSGSSSRASPGASSRRSYAPPDPSRASRNYSHTGPSTTYRHTAQRPGQTVDGPGSAPARRRRRGRAKAADMRLEDLPMENQQRIRDAVMLLDNSDDLTIRSLVKGESVAQMRMRQSLNLVRAASGEPYSLSSDSSDTRSLYSSDEGQTTAEGEDDSREGEVGVEDRSKPLAQDKRKGGRGEGERDGGEEMERGS